MQKELGEDDPALIEEIGKHKLDLGKKYESLLEELKTYWADWDRLPDDAAEEIRRKVRDKMVDLLNRRSYIRNLVRDVNEVLESSN
jgi:molecular chaperone HscB